MWPTIIVVFKGGVILKLIQFVQLSGLEFTKTKMSYVTILFLVKFP